MQELLISNSDKVGGGNRSLLLLQSGLRAEGVHAKVVIPGPGQMSQACEAEKASYEIHAIEQPSWQRPDRLWSTCRGWTRILRESDCQLVHANDITTARSVSLAAWRAGIPVVCHIRFPPGKAVVEWAFRRLPKPAAFVFNSHAMQAECGSDFEDACPRSQQFVVHNAVDVEQFVPEPKTSDRSRVGILANLIPIKGHRDFLQMARLLADRKVAADYWMIGEDIHETGYRRELEELRCTLKLCDAVHFLGHRNDVASLLNELDVVVCASHVEPFGRCLIEAMSCQKPVVATRVGGIPEVVEDGATGFLVPPESPEQLAAAVERLLADDELADRMGRAGRRRVEDHFTAEAHTKAVLAVYESVLNQCP